MFHSGYSIAPLYFSTWNVKDQDRGRENSEIVLFGRNSAADLLRVNTLHVFVPLNETYQSGVCNLRTQDTSAAHLVTQHYDTGNRCDDARPRRWQGVGDVIHAVIQPV